MTHKLKIAIWIDIDLLSRQRINILAKRWPNCCLIEIVGIFFTFNVCNLDVEVSKNLSVLTTNNDLCNLRKPPLAVVSTINKLDPSHLGDEICVKLSPLGELIKDDFIERLRPKVNPFAFACPTLLFESHNQATMNGLNHVIG
jgi:hypothetical protein